MIQNASVLLVVILTGYWFVSRLNQEKISFLTKPNFAILYESAIAGIFLFIFGWIPATLIKVWILDCDYSLILTSNDCSIEDIYPISQSDSLLFAFVYAHFGPWLLNRVYTGEDALEDAARKTGLVPQLILDAMKDRRLIEVTSKRRKVYVGFVLNALGISSKGIMEDVAMMPLFSGYRDANSLSVHLTSRYLPVILKKTAQNDEISADELARAYDILEEELGVLITLNDIVSVRPFSIETHNLFEGNDLVLGTTHMARNEPDEVLHHSPRP